MKSLPVFLAALVSLTQSFSTAISLPVYGQASSDHVKIAQGLQGMSPDERRARLVKLMQMRGRGQGQGNFQPSASSNDSSDLRANVAYGEDPLQKMDIFSPRRSNGPAPILFFVHGGGWSRGDKASRDHSEKAQNYPANGVVFISVNYRLAPAVTHPKQIEDIAAAFAWVKSHASEFGGDPNRIFIMGHSAGAHLVDLLGTNDRYLAAKGLSLADIKGVVSLDTASLDLNKRLDENSVEGELVGPMISRAFGSDPRVLTDGSPTSNIKAGKQYPPFLMFCGSMRRTCVEQHKIFAAEMQKVGGHADVRQVPLSHRDINLQSGETGTNIFNAVLAMVQGRH